MSKGHNRNNVWFSIIEEDWPELEKVHDEWLDLALQGEHQSLSEMVLKRTGEQKIMDLVNSLHYLIPPLFRPFYCSDKRI